MEAPNLTPLEIFDYVLRLGLSSVQIHCEVELNKLPPLPPLPMTRFLFDYNITDIIRGCSIFHWVVYKSSPVIAGWWRTVLTLPVPTSNSTKTGCEGAMKATTRPRRWEDSDRRCFIILSHTRNKLVRYCRLS